jgi:rRNA maturation endonuclease Nob1
MFFKDKDRDKEEASKIWNDLKAAEMCWGCKVILEGLKKEKNVYFHMGFSNGEYVIMKLKFCPRCGRKL